MNLDPMHLILATGFVVIIITFWRAHRSSANIFDALDLIMENGRASKIALAFMLVLAVSTWVIVDQQVNGKLTEGMFGLWLGAWVTPLVARVVFAKTEMPGTTTTSTTSVTQEITEKVAP